MLPETAVLDPDELLVLVFVSIPFPTFADGETAHIVAPIDLHFLVATRTEESVCFPVFDVYPRGYEHSAYVSRG